jgi:flagellar motor protein MotB
MSARDDGLGHSMTDLMSGVAVTFLLIAAIFMVQAFAARVREAEAERKAQAQLALIQTEDQDAQGFLHKLREYFAQDESLKSVVEASYDAHLDPYLLTLTLNRERFFFGSTECELSEDASQAVRDGLRKAVKSVCDAPDAATRLLSINLEGHTDKQPFFPRQPRCGAVPTACASTDEPHCAAIGFENNVRLSGARAQRLFFALRNTVGDDANLAQCLDRWFVVSGRGSVEATGVDDETRQRDRRVVLRIRVRVGSALVIPQSSGAAALQ